MDFPVEGLDSGMQRLKPAPCHSFQVALFLVCLFLGATLRAHSHTHTHTISVILEIGYKDTVKAEWSVFIAEILTSVANMPWLHPRGLSAKSVWYT